MSLWELIRASSNKLNSKLVSELEKGWCKCDLQLHWQISYHTIQLHILLRWRCTWTCIREGHFVSACFGRDPSSARAPTQHGAFHCGDALRGRAHEGDAGTHGIRVGVREVQGGEGTERGSLTSCFPAWMKSSEKRCGESMVPRLRQSLRWRPTLNPPPANLQARTHQDHPQQRTPAKQRSRRSRKAKDHSSQVRPTMVWIRWMLVAWRIRTLCDYSDCKSFLHDCLWLCNG